MSSWKVFCISPDKIKFYRALLTLVASVLRLYPVGPVNARIATKDTTLPAGGGPHGTQPILIQRGQQVLYCVYGMHRRKDLYGVYADDFRPERWDQRRQGWDFLPFNGGARQCLGRKLNFQYFCNYGCRYKQPSGTWTNISSESFAMMEASYILVRLLQEFDDIQPRSDRPWQEHLGLILSNLHGTFLDLSKKT